jgi:ferric-dicitrate binding protein FerR (iron transport regulator)
MYRTMKKNENNTARDELIIRYLSGESSAAESKKILNWLKEDGENQEYFDEIKKIWDHSKSLDLLLGVKVEDALEKVKGRVKPNSGKELKIPTERKISWLHQFMKVAAVFLVFIVSAYFLNQFYKNRSSSGLIAHSAIEQISDLTLEDGTKLYVNSGSTVRYPETFSKKSREVELRGEAYFEVAENPDKPFIIHLEETASVKVLGTAFNVRSDTVNGDVIVHVLSGKVSLYNPANEQDGVILSKSEVGRYSEGRFTSETFTTMNFMSWRTGILEFDNTPLDKAIRKIKRHYNREILLEIPDPATIFFTSTFHEQSFEDVIEEIVLVLGFQSRYQNDTIIIYQ